MVSNSKLRGQTIHSLSKFASAKGLREKLTFKIGYDISTILETSREHGIALSTPQTHVVTNKVDNAGMIS